MQAEDCSRRLPHKQCIIYLKTDLISNLPEFTSKPAIIQWDGNVVACNEVARSFGICEHISLISAYEACPGLQVLGLEHIVRLAAQVNVLDGLLRNFKVVIERVSLDECYLEITDNSLAEKLNCSPWHKEGFQRGVNEKLRAAGLFGSELQMAIGSEARIKCRMGVSYSKMLARLAALKGDPGQLKIISPSNAKDALRCEDVRLVMPGFLANALIRRGIRTTQDIRDSNLEELEGAVGSDLALLANDAACGNDLQPVTPRDSWRLLSIQMEISEKFSSLLVRLLAQVEDEGRIPQVVKVSVRKYDPVRKTNSKDFKSAPIPSIAQAACRRPSSEAVNKLMNLILSLFYRLVDFSKPVHLSLLGLAFVRFQDSPRMKLAQHTSPNSSAHFVSHLLRKRDVSVETPLCISYEGDSDLVRCSLPKDILSDVPDADEMPTPREKKAKLDIYIKNLRDEQMDLCSPSKLKVADLSLGDEMNPRKKPRGLLQC